MSTEQIKIIRGFVYNGGEVSQHLSIEDGAMVLLDESIPDSSDGLEVTFALDVSELSAVVIACDQAITIKTNSDLAPDDTIVTVANQMITWISGVDLAAGKPFTVDVTTNIFVDNASGAAARLRVYAPFDPTPA